MVSVPVQCPHCHSTEVIVVHTLARPAPRSTTHAPHASSVLVVPRPSPGTKHHIQRGCEEQGNEAIIGRE